MNARVWDAYSYQLLHSLWFPMEDWEHPRKGQRVDAYSRQWMAQGLLLWENAEAPVTAGHTSLGVEMELRRVSEDALCTDNIPLKSELYL